jgi:hypothetical protein
LTTEERFWSKVVKTESCWLWTGFTSKGYGKFFTANKSVRAHRWSWENKNGPIPEGTDILHSCIGQRNCVNPDHLRPGTNQENVIEKVSQGRQAKGETNGRAKLTESQVLDIREKYKTGNYTQKQLAILVGLKGVGKILLNERWKHIMEKN